LRLRGGTGFKIENSLKGRKKNPTRMVEKTPLAPGTLQGKTLGARTKHTSRKKTEKKDQLPVGEDTKGEGRKGKSSGRRD